jgi:hypothetical protein
MEVDLDGVFGFKIDLEKFLNIFLELFEGRTAAANDDTGARNVHEDIDGVDTAFDLDGGDTGELQFIFQVAANTVVLKNVFSVVFEVAKPDGFCRKDVSGSKNGWIDFFTHVI